MGDRIVMVLSLLLITSTAPAAEVRLRSSAGCSAPVVRLADIAEVLCEDARIAEALAEIPLCPAPPTGGQRSLSQHDVRQLLALSGVEPGAASVTGSEAVAVLGEGGIHVSRLAKRPLVATGVRQAVFEADSEPPARSVATPPKVTAPEPKEAAPVLVARGAIVTVQARTAGVQITTSGKALDAGVAGQVVGVELADNKQRVLARVTGPQVVDVAVDGSAASVANAPSKPAGKNPEAAGR